jgi:hypothetical protein
MHSFHTGPIVQVERREPVDLIGRKIDFVIRPYPFRFKSLCLKSNVIMQLPIEAQLHKLLQVLYVIRNARSPSTRFSEVTGEVRVKRKVDIGEAYIIEPSMSGVSLQLVAVRNVLFPGTWLQFFPASPAVLDVISDKTNE